MSSIIINKGKNVKFFDTNNNYCSTLKYENNGLSVNNKKVLVEDDLDSINTNIEINNNIIEVNENEISLLKNQIDSISIATGTQAEMLAISSPSTGQQFLISPSNKADSKLCVYNGETWQVAGETYQTKSSQALEIGNIVETDLASPDRVKKAQQVGDKDILGVVVFSAATGANQNVTIAYAGRWDVRCISATYTQTLYIKTHSTDGVGSGQNSMQAGVFARPLETITIPFGGGLLKCILFNAKSKV